jgi:plasmid stabilization system protein ParE
MPAAAWKVAGHIEFLSRVSPAAAARLRHALEADIADLQTHPERFSRYETAMPTDKNLRKRLSNKRYWLVFDFGADTVTVVDVQDCRQNPDNNLI